MNEERIQIWWIPNVPAKAFRRDVADIEEGKRLLNALVDYTRYLEQRGYMSELWADAGGIEVMVDGEWEEWYDYENDEPWEYEFERSGNV